METYISFHKIIDLLQQYQESNPRINSFGYGNLVDFGKNVSGSTVVYPFLFVIPQSITYDENITTYQITMIFADRLNETLDNEVDCISDQSLNARNFLSQIKRGDLQDYFDITLPQNAQPFMERFNDNVAGVALDANIVVYEDINACLQYPTPTPSNTPGLTPSVTPSVTATQTNTPSVTPTNTQTPSVTPTSTPTPSVTPTFTPTPSTTPPTSQDPNTLNALWWIDYTDPNYVSLSGGNVIGVKNRTGNPDFSGKTGQSQGYDPTGYNGVSGATRTGFGVFSLSGDYNTSISAYTQFFAFSAETSSQAIISQSDNTTDYSGNTQPYRWFSIDDFTSFPSTELRTYTFYTGGSSVTPEPNYIYNAGQWYFGATRVFQSGSTANVEFWIDGSLVDSTSQNGQTIVTAVNPIFQIGGSGGPDFKISEAFFFDYKLDNTQMGQMFTYLNNKY